ncbi:hypothetical protein [Flavobacterium aestivum]|uniref:hypothetical protein n=1 Tax=Flavobacterium aestivum TaxID=3003257 RepID=UPI0022868C07|nr:hypothetical protein [Flavobacterium aestivum]
MKNLTTHLFLIALALASCKNEAETKESNIPKVIVPFTQVAIPQQNQAVATPQPNQNQSVMYQNNGGQYTTTQNTTTTVQTVAAPVKVAKGMNPSHGQPGHRCDIAVGAPLNSPITTTKATAPQIVSNTSVSVPSATATPTPKGMNPPHGQPGHRCDIAVGAPLNSPVTTAKPATTQTTPTYSVTAPTNETTTPTPAATPIAQ